MYLFFVVWDWHVQFATQESTGATLPPPQHIINSYLTRTICVQGSGAVRETGGGGEQRRGRRRDLSSWLTTFLFFVLSRQTSSLKSETAEVAWLHWVFSALCRALSLCLSSLFLQTGFTPSELTPTETLILLQWMVSEIFFVISSRFPVN